MPKNTHIRIGRGQQNQVILNHEQIAEEHLELFADHEGNVFITDLGSVQGTKVNGIPLRGFKELRNNDEVILGGKVKFNWKKYQINDVQPTPKVNTAMPFESKPEIPKQIKGKVVSANLEIESRQLYLIYGGILLLILIIYLIN